MKGPGFPAVGGHTVVTVKHLGQLDRDWIAHVLSLNSKADLRSSIVS